MDDHQRDDDRERGSGDPGHHAPPRGWQSGPATSLARVALTGAGSLRPHSSSLEPEAQRRATSSSRRPAWNSRSPAAVTRPRVLQSVSVPSAATPARPVCHPRGDHHATADRRGRCRWHPASAAVGACRPAQGVGRSAHRPYPGVDHRAGVPVSGHGRRQEGPWHRRADCGDHAAPM